MDEVFMVRQLICDHPHKDQLVGCYKTRDKAEQVQNERSGRIIETIKVEGEEDDKLIYPDDYDVVICVDGSVGRLFEHGVETTHYVKKVELSHEAGDRAELTVKRQVASREVIEQLRNKDS